MSEDFKKLIELAKTYYDTTVTSIKLMRASRDYAELNEAIAEVYDNMDELENKLNILNTELIHKKEEEELTNEEYSSYVDALSNIGYALLLISKSKETYEYVYKSLNKIEEVASAKKETKVSNGKTVDKEILPIINDDSKSNIKSAAKNTNIAKIYTKR